MLLKVSTGLKGSDSNSVTVPQMQKMARNFNMHPEGGWDSMGAKRGPTHFGNFPLSQILQLLLDDQVIQPTDTVSDLLKNRAAVGLTFYFGQHASPDDCPATTVDYIGCNNIFLVTSEFDGQKWNDLINYNDPNENKNGIAKSVLFNDGGEVGTDKANLCPPQCSFFGNTLYNPTE